MRRAACSADGVEVAFEVRGRGSPTIVFVHGWSCDRSYWDAQLSEFASRYRVIAVDLAGHGDSGLGRDRWTMEAFADDVVAAVDAVCGSEGRVVLVGHSMGGDVIVPAARKLAGRVAGLVWIDTYHQLGPARSAVEIEAELEPFRRDFAGSVDDVIRKLCGPQCDAALVEWIVEDMASAPPDIAIDALEHAISYQPAVEAQLRTIEAPVVAINGGARPTDVEALARHGISAVVMEGAGHFLLMEDPETFNRLLAEVVDGFRG